MNKYNKIILGVLLLSPSFTYAEVQTLKTIARLIAEYLNIGISLIIGLAVVVFVWNVFIYFFTEQKEKKDAGMYVLYSVIGFFVILSFWGIVAVFRNTINLDDKAPSFINVNLNNGSTGTGNGSFTPISPGNNPGNATQINPGNNPGGATQINSGN